MGILALLPSLISPVLYNFLYSVKKVKAQYDLTKFLGFVNEYTPVYIPNLGKANGATHNRGSNLKVRISGEYVHFRKCYDMCYLYSVFPVSINELGISPIPE